MKENRNKKSEKNEENLSKILFLINLQEIENKLREATINLYFSHLRPNKFENKI